MNEQLSFDACGFCGVTSGDVHRRLVEWVEPVEGRRWAYVPRCDDRLACRTRVEALGEPWPVNDRTPEPPRPELELMSDGWLHPQDEGYPHDEVAPSPPPEPVPPADAPPADVEEEISWMR